MSFLSEQQQKFNDSSENNQNWRDKQQQESVHFNKRHWQGKNYFHNKRRQRSNTIKKNEQHGPRFGILLKCIKTNRYLMVRERCNGFMGAPKGVQEQNEDHFTCAQRECIEETGLYININDLKIAHLVIPFKKNENRKYTFFLLGCVKEYQCNIGEHNTEIDHYAWMSFEEMKNVKQAYFTQKALAEANCVDSNCLTIVDEVKVVQNL